MALIVGCGSSKSDDELVVYFVPSRDSKEIQSATQPLADMLKEELNMIAYKWNSIPRKSLDYKSRPCRCSGWNVKKSCCNRHR